MDTWKIEAIGPAGYTRRDLIDLSVEYGMVRSTLDFAGRSEKAQQKILATIEKIARTMDWG